MSFVYPVVYKQSKMLTFWEKKIIETISDAWPDVTVSSV